MLIAAVVGPLLPGSVWGWIALAVLGAAVGRRVHALVPLMSACLIVCLLRGLPLGGDARLVLPGRPQTVTVRLKIQGDARTVQLSGGRSERRQPARLMEVSQRGQWTRIHGRVQLRWPDPAEAGFLPGSVYEGTGVLEPADLPHVGLRRASWKLEIASPGDLTKKGTGPGSPMEWVFSVRERIAHRVESLSVDQAPERSVILGLLLGMRTEIDDAQMKEFAASGLIHLFAISGLHLGLLATLLILGGRQLGFGLRWQVFWILPGLCLFCVMTGLRASAVRALLMMAFVYAAPLCYRRANGRNALAFAVTVILALAPEQVRDPGFQFSVLLVGGLLLVWPEVDEWLRDRCARDPWAPVTPGFVVLETYVIHPVLRALGVSFVCVLISTPLTAYYFRLFSPVGLLGNLIAVPLVFLLLASGFLSLPFLLLPDAWAGLCLQVPLRLAELLLNWVSFLRTIPYGVQWVRPPPVWVLMVSGILLIAWVRKGRMRKVAVGAGLVLAGALATDAVRYHHSRELVVMDAGRGQAGWIRNGAEGTVVVDTGSNWSGWRLADSLKNQGVNRISALILTHPDAHHTGGLASLFESWTPEQIYVPATDVAHPLFQDIGAPVNPLQAGDQLRVAGLSLEILHPPVPSPSRRSDERSLVLRVTSGPTGVLWMGGASETVEARMMSDRPMPAAGVVVAGHDPSHPGLSPDFLGQVQPRLVITSGNGYEGMTEARIQTEARARNMGIAVVSPPEQDVLRIRLPSGGIIP